MKSVMHEMLCTKKSIFLEGLAEQEILSFGSL